MRTRELLTHRQGLLMGAYLLIHILVAIVIGFTFGIWYASMAAIGITLLCMAAAYILAFRHRKDYDEFCQIGGMCFIYGGVIALTLWMSAVFSGIIGLITFCVMLVILTLADRWVNRYLHLS